MKIALIGYGKMGKVIEQVALNRGHQVILIVDKDNPQDLCSPTLKEADVAIEFTTPYSAVANIKTCADAQIPVVCGSTGWHDKLKEVEEYVTMKGGALFHSTNFSLGVNIFLKVNAYLASIMSKFDNYNVEIEEWHHNQKLDSPSGTAITLAETIMKNYPSKKEWVNESTNELPKLGILSIRKDSIPGIHTTTYESDVDTITFTHSAKGREGLATGAVLAAEFVADKKGVFTMENLLSL